ncbi:hypothetical protein HNR06_001185 [Nocardiopsis arvandica]|uniref:Uncharacterized protein n=1 Tax=Nocardiopsis sinuspersici TaxID=501010 RepID=A0A7Y9X9B2_9ACTN|nr:hypothetical protein [Nocardiopsis sinuspersici]NYH51596.1 hypothetical protein [Nocardiopsis sinuspersici]
MVVSPLMLLISLLLRHRTWIARRLLERLRSLALSLSLGSTAWPAAGRRWGDWAAAPTVLWALCAGLAAAGITVGVWHVLRAGAGGRRRPHVSVFVLSVVFSLTLGSLMAWSVAVAV